MNRPRNQRQLPSQATTRRPGDHYFVDVEFQTKPSTSGETATVLGIALGAAPVPERRYVADVCFVTHDSTGIKIVFGQLKLFQNAELRSAVVVKMSRRGISHFLSAVDAISNPSYQDIVDRLDSAPMELPAIANEPDQVVSLAANLAITAMSDEEASIDFLQLSPFSMAMMAKGAHQAAIDPVVRIDLNSTMFFSLLQTLRNVPGVSRDLMEVGP